MTKRIHVVDSGGTPRLVRAGRFFVVDSGGVTRKIKKLWTIDSGGVARQVYQSTITTGDNGSQYGYALGNYGAIGDGTYDDNVLSPQTIRIVLWDGIAVQFWLNGANVPDTDDTFVSITLDGQEFTRASRTTYNGGQAGPATSWLWSSAYFPASTPTAVTLQIS
jgi:hypothetical protein